MKIAVIGSGVSGLSAAWLLAPHHEVEIFEKNGWLGGHAHTALVQGSSGQPIAVDTGFMVFNPVRYPNLTKLFEHFGVETLPTDMSFAVSMDGGAFEYSSKVPKGIFADRENILRVSFYEFLEEILRFNAAARAALEKGVSPHTTLRDFLTQHKFSDDFEQKYLLPMVGSIWSTPKKLARDFPCGPLLEFLNGHHLLAAVGHPQWRTPKGGSVQYVEKVTAEVRAQGGVFHANDSVVKVKRDVDGVTVISKRKHHRYDAVVFACHADEALALLARPSREERLLLSKFKYEANDVYLHSDESLMPRRKDAWAAWNYLGVSGWGRKTKKVSLTYYMNILQSLPTDLPVFVTLNPPVPPRRDLVHGRFSYAHPLCTCVSMETRTRLQELQGKNATYFCGSYFGYGFHEDGITSAIEAVRHLGVRPPWEVE